MLCCVSVRSVPCRSASDDRTRADSRFVEVRPLSSRASSLDWLVPSAPLAMPSLLPLGDGEGESELGGDGDDESEGPDGASCLPRCRRPLALAGRPVWRPGLAGPPVALPLYRESSSSALDMADASPPSARGWFIARWRAAPPNIASAKLGCSGGPSYEYGGGASYC